MYQRLTFAQFIAAMVRADKAQEFTVEGLGLLYDHLEKQDSNYVLDANALRLAWSQCPLGDALTNMNVEDFEDFEDLQGFTTAFLLSDGNTVIYQEL